MRYATPLLLLLALVPLIGGQASAEDDAELKAKRANGLALFQRAVKWIRGTQPPIKAITSAHLRFDDVQFTDPKRAGSHSAGFIDLWFSGTEKYREEHRIQRNAKLPDKVKLLNGQNGWTQSNGRAFRADRGPDGIAAIIQRKKDAEQLVNLARFITPTALNGKGVSWTLDGDQELPPPLAEAGTPAFQRVRRDAPGENPMVFYFRETQTPAATYPYAVYIHGTQAADGTVKGSEWFVLDRWRRAPGARARPGRIQGFTAEANKQPKRFALLFPGAFKLNPTLPDSLFRPPASPPASTRKTSR